MKCNYICLAALFIVQFISFVVFLNFRCKTEENFEQPLEEIQNISLDQQYLESIRKIGEILEYPVFNVCQVYLFCVFF